MKAGIHPDYHNVNFIMTDGTTFTTRTTKGKEGDTVRLDVDSKSHPAYTGGEQRLMQSDQGDKFSKRFGAFTGGSSSQKTSEKTTESADDKAKQTSGKKTA